MGFGKIAVSQVVAEPPADGSPFRVEGSYRQKVRQVEVLHHRHGLLDEPLHHVQALHVDGVVAFEIDGAGHAPHEVVGVGVLATEDRVDFDDFLLPAQRLQVMRHRHEVRLGRQLVRRVPPVGVLEDAQLPGLHEALEGGRHVGEIARRSVGPLGGNLLRQLGGGFRIRLERGNHVHPVQRVEVVKVNHVVLHVLGELHHVADDLRVRWHGDPQGVLHGTHRSQGVDRGAHATDALAERPGVPGVAPLEDQLQAAPHGARGKRIADLAVLPEDGLDAQVPLDTGHGIHNDAVACHGPPPFQSFFSSPACRSRRCSARRLTAYEAKWAATPAPAAMATVLPIWSAVDSTPGSGTAARRW